MKNKLVDSFFKDNSNDHLIAGDKILYIWPDKEDLEDKDFKDIFSKYDLFQLPDKYYLPFFRLDKNFDAIICFDVLSVVPDPYMILLNIIQCLDYDGVIFINTKYSGDNIDISDFFVMDIDRWNNIFSKLNLRIVYRDKNNFILKKY